MSLRTSAARAFAVLLSLSPLAPSTGCSDDALAPTGASSRSRGDERISIAPDGEAVSEIGPDASDEHDAMPGKNETFVGQHGALQANGNQIRDRNGQPIQLRGMSLFWSQWASPFYNVALIETLVSDWGVTVVRAAMAVESGGYLEDPDAEQGRVEVVVDAAIARGIYVVIDWHDHNAHQHTSQAQTFFSAMAAKYGNVPNVIFEVFNEPENIAWSTVKTYATTILSTIRGAGARNLVIVGSPDWSTDAHIAAADPVDDDNVAYTFHFYAGSHGKSYRDDALLALQRGVPLFVTEWGTCQSWGNGTVDLDESQRWLDFLAEHHVSWANWSLFDKNESCAALVPGASTTGPWAANALTTSGTFVKNQIRASAP